MVTLARKIKSTHIAKKKNGLHPHRKAKIAHVMGKIYSRSSKGVIKHPYQAAGVLLGLSVLSSMLFLRMRK